MKTLLPTTIIAMLLGCSTEPQASSRAIAPTEVAEANEKFFAVMKDPPDALLETMRRKYSGSNQEWRDAWKIDNAKNNY